MTPSELVLLHPDSFTEEGGALTAKVMLPDGRTLASEKLGHAVVQAALLANEASGRIRLEVREGRRFFGLMRTRSLMAVPASADGESWPEGSLEAAVAAATAAGEVAVRTLVERMIATDRDDPAADLAREVMRGLSRRGILAEEEAKVMKVFTVTRFAMTDAARADADAQGIAGVQAMLNGARSDRPELWTEMERAIRGAINFMTKSSD